MKSEYEQFKPELPNLLAGLEQSYMVTHMDRDGSITYTNHLFLETSRWTPKRVLGKTLWQMFPDTPDGQEQAHTIWEMILSEQTFSGTVEKVTRLGEPYFVKMTAVPVVRADEGLISAVFFELNITEDVELREQLQQIAFIDYETGLMSRHNLETTVQKRIKELENFAFVYISIDHFYTLTESLSVETGKEIIQSFANRLKRFFHDSPIARVGVNEFVILTPFGDWYIEGFLDFLKQHPIYIDNTALQLFVSGGIVRYPEDQKTYTQLLNAALSATKAVSDEGGGKITTLSKASHIQLNRKSIIDRKLLTALNDNDLEVFYQPVLDLATGTIVQYEALVRWNDEELGAITPDELIPIAEENGLIHKIGTFVLTEAAQLAARWKDEGHELKVSVNSSVREFGNPKFKEDITGILKEASCPPSLIELEVTENFAFKAEEESSISNQMNQLQDEGIAFTLDDFGTGYASFRYMQTLPITKVKIDKLFIQSMTTHEQTRKLVEGMIQFGKSMGLYVVAEGVETKEQLDLLKSLNIDAAQGYYIGVPVTENKITFTANK